jgi:tagatose 1,6-diphosphate aldolase
MAALLPRPFVLLSAGGSSADFERSLHYAYRAGASGYLAGRAIWWEAFQRYPDVAAFETALSRDGRAYLERINALTDRLALPWMDWPRLGGVELDAGNEFPKGYAA